MSERRMFTQKITESDAFIEMPMSSQALYFHLCMNADDDGFVKNPKSIQRLVGCNNDDIKLLIAKRFILPFDSGIIVIKHWRMHNLLRKDRYKETEYLEEKSMLYLKENGAYTLDKNQGKTVPKIGAGDNDNQMATVWQPNGNQMAPQDSIGKGSKEIDKYSIEENSIVNNEESKQVKNKKERPTYDEIFRGFGTSNELKEAVIEFIRYLKTSKNIVMLNDRLETLLVKLDFKYGTNEVLKCKEVRRAITNGYKRLECEEV